MVLRLSSKWFYYAAGFLIIINIAGIFNNFENFKMMYPTSVYLNSFIGYSVASGLLSIIFLASGFVMPGMAGESLNDEVFPQNKNNSLLCYIRFGFFNRGIVKGILLGYIVWVIMLGLQAVIFYFGQSFLGVWKERHTMVYFSSTYMPVLGAFIIGSTASLNEEIFYRLFGISYLKKYLHSSILAVIAASVIWGMGHTLYAIFPVWFRIIEIGIIGLLYGFIFLRFGLIPLIVAHYLFDVFWCSSAYILGRSNPYLLFSSVGLLCIPLGFAIIAYFVNKTEEEKPVQIVLDAVQKYNLQILITFVSVKKSQGYTVDMIKRELIRYHWDHSLVNLAIEEVYKK